MPSHSRYAIRHMLILIILLLIHSPVEVRDLFAVTVEHQSLSPEEFTDAPFRGLAPARMVDFRVHIGIETVFLRLHHIPRRRRLFLDEADLDDGFNAFETVFPWYHDPGRRSVLRRQRFAVKSYAEYRQRVHRFVHA